MSDGWIPESSSRKIPYQVQQLARMVAYAFYGKEHGLIVDILCKHSSVKEDDLCDLLKLEKKHFRNILQALKGDQIIASKQRITKDEKDVSLRSFEYGLEYSSLLNLVKYKLDLMRQKLEAEQRTNANRASFTCLQCKKMFSDLEAGQLFDPQSGNMACTICGSEVEEAPAALEDSQQVVMAKFNEHLTPFFDLIREIDQLDLRPDDLRSDFSENPYSLERANAQGGSQGGNQGNWTGDRARGDYNYIPQAITINIGEAEVKQQKVRQQPVWLTHSTVVPDEGADGGGGEKGTEGAGTVGGRGTGEGAGVKDDEVLSMLMRHEKKVFEEENQQQLTPPPSVDEEMEGVEEAEDDETAGGPRVRVGEAWYALDEVTDDLVAKMTEEEKDAYIRVGQEAYADMFA